MRRSCQARLPMPQKKIPPKMPPSWSFPTCLKKKPHLKSRFAARMRTMRKPALPQKLQLQNPELSYVASFHQIYLPVSIPWLNLAGAQGRSPLPTAFVGVALQWAMRCRKHCRQRGPLSNVQSQYIGWAPWKLLQPGVSLPHSAIGSENQ